MTFQSSVGLISGLPITDIVDQLMAVAAKPRERLENRTLGYKQQQVAIGELTALTIGTQLASNKLASSSVYQQRLATSSNSSLLTASITGNAVSGTYQFTPVRMAQNHQLISTGVGSLDDAVGGGSLSLQFGGFADRGVDLSTLNGGAGVERGKIRITDRSGESEVIDLRFALTMDDVLNQINRSDIIDVLAVAEGDAIRLIDQTGLSTTNLSVREVAGGQTAADLGLGSIDVAASQATGQDLVRLFEQLNVSQLNDHSGLSIRDELPDLEVTFRDGSGPLLVDFNSQDVTTVGKLLDALNAADPARLHAQLSSDGKRLVLTDLTSDAGATFAVSSAMGGTLAEDLGLTTTAAGDVLTGRRLIGGLKGPLLGSLAGGQGLGPLGGISLTDRSGASVTVDLSTAETLNEVLDLLNSSGIGITAAMNKARNGILLQDTTGVTTGNLIVANADATNTADALGVAINAAQQRIDGGSLHLQVFHEGLRLDALNNGQGVALGSFLITDSTGTSSGVNLRTAEAKTVGDVLELINGLGLAVNARINDTGDGILLVDTANGGGTLKVMESGTGSTAADLKLAGEATEVDIEGTPTQVIDGAMTAKLTLDAEDTLQDVVDKINALNVGVTANITNSGSGSTPYRIALSSQLVGAAGEMLLDASQFGLGFQQIAAAQDAVLQVGSSDSAGAGILTSSSTNQFTNVIEGLRLTVGGVSDTPVSVSVTSTDKDLVSSVKLLVDQYNMLRTKISTLTFFDAERKTTGILTGSNEALQIETRLARLVTSRFLGVGSVQSLTELGVSVTDAGLLELDEAKLSNKFADDPESVEQFFTHAELGFVGKFNAAVESIAGEENSLLIIRNDTLQQRIEANTEKIEFYNERLEVERERLLKYYYNLELTISKIRANVSAIESIAPLPMPSDSST
ncbi:MAG: flagellar filament capping protein FliD [Pirellulaceae bacterium]